MGRQRRTGFVMGDGLETVLTPSPLKRPKLMATANRRAHLGAVRVDHHILCRKFSQLPFTAHGGDEAVRTRRRRAQVRSMHEHQPLRRGRIQINDHGLLYHHHYLRDQKWMPQPTHAPLGAYSSAAAIVLDTPAVARLASGTLPCRASGQTMTSPVHLV